MHRLTTPARATRRRLIAMLLALLTILTVATACNSDDKKGQASDGRTQQTNYNGLVAQQPAHKMAYSPTRRTINGWIDTWGHDPNKLAYVYLQNAEGTLLGYYVFKGLPVSYCTSITQNYKIIQDDNDNGQMSVPAPAMDGVYYSGSECNTYYGFDATTGAYIEYTAGLGINVLVYDQPLAQHPNVVNLAPRSK